MNKRSSRRPGIVIMVRLLALVGSLAWIILLAVAAGVAGYLCAMGVTVFGAMGIATVLGDSMPLSIPAIMAGAVICGILRGLLRWAEQYSNHYIAFRLLAVLRDRVFRHLRVLSPAKLESKQKGAIIAMLTADIETLEVFYAHTISPICIAILVSLAVLIFVAVFVSPWMSLATLIAYLIIGIVLPLLSSARLASTGVAYRQEFSDFNAFLLDSVRGIRELVLHNAAPNRMQEVDDRSARLQEQTIKAKKGITHAAAFTEFCVSSCILVVLAVGFQLCDNGLSIGRMLVGAVTIFSSFGPVIAISALPGNLTQTFASGDRLLNLMEEQPVVTPVTDGVDFTFRSLAVQDLRFAYGNTPVLQDASFTAETGEIVGIVGPSGCGKSTLLKLLLRFWEKDGGEILYNGTDIAKINTDSLLDNVTLVSQSTYLFDKTIEENLRLAKPDATREELDTACRRASVLGLIQSLPEGYQTRVGTLGDRLSAGEKQRLGLARAFLHDAPVILLDEPTSNVDSQNEKIILRAIAAQKQNKCFILISHRASTMAIADRIYTLQNGIMKEEALS